MSLDNLSQQDLQSLAQELQGQYETLKQESLALDITRGKPSAEQLDLSESMLHPDQAANLDNTDLRNYGGLYGLPSARKLGAEIIGGVKEDEVLVGGNSSLTLMYQSVLFSYLFGPSENETPWQQQNPKFICPVPGYDRHFSVCEELGIEMLTVSMTDTGPDMDQVEDLIKNDSSIKGIWCVPKYSNPTGCVYSDETVERIAKLGNIAGEGFRVFWDNAYAVHDLHDTPPQLANIMEYCRQHGTESAVLQFASTSKVTFAGSGIAWLASSESNISAFVKHLGMSTIGPDKLNQAKHLNFLPDLAAVKSHMAKHAALLRPRFACVLETLEQTLGNDGTYATWLKPEGGYFVSVDTHPNLASEVIQLAKGAGVKLTPAGSTYPYKKDPDNSNIRIAPSFPTLPELEKAMEVFTVCVKLATVKSKLR